jgi:hypothetical protein
MRALPGLIVVALSVSASKPAWAKEPIAINASLSEDHVTVGDSLTLEVHVIAHADGAIEVAVPAVDGLTEVSRSKSEGTSISFSGAGQEVTKEYTITLEYQVEKAGKLTIPPITASIGGTRASTSPLVVNSGGESAEAAPAAPKPGQVEPPSPNEAKLFIRYVVDRSEAFVGQQIVVDLNVYAARDLNFGIEEANAPPSLDKFWREILDQPQRLTRTIETVQGHQYSVYRLWRVALFPLEAGAVTIPAQSITFAVNQGIFGGGRHERRKAPPIKLEVKSPPGDGRPASFKTQNVGAYTFSASVDRTTVPAGKAVVLTLKIAGRGNIKNTKLPDVPPIPGFRVFDPTVSDDVKLDATGVSGEKKAEVLLMPEAGGRLEIPGFELTVFDPEQAKYERLTSPTIRIAVEGNPAAIAQSVQAPPNVEKERPSEGEQTRSLSKESLRPLRFRSALEAHSDAPWKRASVGALFLAPPALYVLMMIAEHLLARARRETPESRRRRAAREAHQRLKAASDAVRAENAAKAYAELYEALISFASEKSGLILRGMTKDEMNKGLIDRGASTDLVDRILAELEAADYARFAPGMYDAAKMAGALERWEALLEDIETWRPKEAA